MKSPGISEGAVMPRRSKLQFVPGTMLNGNLIKDVIDHIVYMECRFCGNPFERTKAKLRFYTPSSCGCCKRMNHNKIMGTVFRKYRETMTQHTRHPLRIQRRRTKGFRLPDNAVCVSRGTMFGNPFSTAAAFQQWLESGTVDRDSLLTVLSEEGLKEIRRLILDHLPSIAGRHLACWCRLDQPCHADVLAAMANTLRENRHAR